MADTNRYEAMIDAGTLYIEGERGRFEIGPIDGIVNLLGGETYTLEYTDRQSAAAWLATDEENTISFDVRETLEDWGYTDELVSIVKETPLEEDGESGYPIRTEVFVDQVRTIWDAKGDIEA